MKVRLTKTITVNDDERRAIAHYNGNEGKASHKEVVSFLNDKEAPLIKKVLIDYYAAQAKRFYDMAGES